MRSANMKKLSVIVVLIAAFSAAACAAVIDAPDNSSGVAGKYSTIGIGAAASGMGNAYLGASQDAVSIFWNPAGLSNMKRKETEWNMFFAHNMWLSNMNIDNISLAKSFKNIGVFAAALSYYSYDSMEAYGLDYAQNPVDLHQTFSAYAASASIAYSNTLDKDIDYGIVMKYFYDSIDVSSASALAFDLGLRYFFQPLKGLSFNLVAKNLGGELAGNSMDKEIAFGALYTAEIEKWTITADYDVVGKVRNTAIQRVGIEFKTPYYATLRAGYSTDNTLVENGFRNVSFGAGINVAQKYTVDFSFEPYGDLGNVYKASFGADF
jgi:opacity protein-like surface antigen